MEASAQGMIKRERLDEFGSLHGTERESHRGQAGRDAVGELQAPREFGMEKAEVAPHL